MKVRRHTVSRYIIFYIMTVAFVSFFGAASAKEASVPVPVPAPEGVMQSRKAFDDWVVSFKREAETKRGFSKKLLDEAFADVSYNDRVITLDRSQPHSTMTFPQYLERVLPDSRIKKARQLYHENRKLLDKIGKKYGVQPRFIVALWGIESNFGQNMGGFSIIESLATLAFEGRRANFFKDELYNALAILKNGDVKPRDMKGSWAGAMGMTQFMPSSYLELAVDYNGDGKRDIWGSKADAFASIANYLSKRGWDKHTTWGRGVRLPAHFDMSKVGRDIEKSIKTWHNLGVKSKNGGSLPLKRGDVLASIVQPDEHDRAFYMVYPNYKTIMTWNRSLYFATAVGIFSDRIGNL